MRPAAAAHRARHLVISGVAIRLRFKVVTEGGSGLPLLLNLVARDMSGCVPIFMRQKYPRTRFYKKGDFMLTPYHRLSWHCDSQIKGY